MKKIKTVTGFGESSVGFAKEVAVFEVLKQGLEIRVAAVGAVPGVGGSHFRALDRHRVGLILMAACFHFRRDDKLEGKQFV